MNAILPGTDVLLFLADVVLVGVVACAAGLAVGAGPAGIAAAASRRARGRLVRVADESGPQRCRRGAGVAGVSRGGGARACRCAGADGGGGGRTRKARSPMRGRLPTGGCANVEMAARRCSRWCGRVDRRCSAGGCCWRLLGWFGCGGRCGRRRTGGSARLSRRRWRGWGFGRRVGVYETDAAAVPFSLGVVWPAIVLPAGLAGRLTPEVLRLAAPRGGAPAAGRPCRGRAAGGRPGGLLVEPAVPRRQRRAVAAARAVVRRPCGRAGAARPAACGGWSPWPSGRRTTPRRCW